MKTALITGGAARIGAQIAKTLHNNDFNIIIHCNQSKDKAQLLCDELNLLKEKSAKVVVGNLNNIDSINAIVESIESIDLLVNNASVFYPLSVDESDSENWDNILDVNLKAPFFLSKGLSQKLKSSEGSIINICLLYTSPSPRDLSTSRMPSSA